MTDTTRLPAAELGDDATAEAARRARETLLAQGGTQLPLLAGAAMLLLEPRTWTAEVWFGAAFLLPAIVAMLVWEFGSERGREDRAEVLVAEYAVLRSVDPGVGRRAAADTVAKGFVVSRYVAWPLWLGAVALLLTFGQWDRPEWAAPGAVLVAVGAAVHLGAAEREARAGRRWLAGPPGPPRT